MTIEYEPIGIVHSPFTEVEGVPIQPAYAEDARGAVEIFPPYREGLKDLDGFSHVILIYHFHRAGRSRLTVTPFLDDEERGVFATRAPVRPNALGLSVVGLSGIEGGMLKVSNLDILDGTPLLDIKPYVREFDPGESIRTGWLETASRERKNSDERFTG
jgi:tRNA-Thr(GGU) m(6)t(6)A37 methyltransferase TsaA